MMQITGKFLVQNGYRLSNTLFKKYADSSWYKLLRDFRPWCNCNQHGIQINVNVYSFDGLLSYTVSVVGECSDGQWVNLESYSINDRELLQREEQRVLKAWTACQRRQ